MLTSAILKSLIRAVKLVVKTRTTREAKLKKRQTRQVEDAAEAAREVEEAITISSEEASTAQKIFLILEAEVRKSMHQLIVKS